MKAIEENGLPIAAVAGTSAGSLVGALHCAGIPATEMLRLVKKSKIFSARTINPGYTHFFSQEPIRKVLQSLLPPTFEELSKPLFATATELVYGECKIISSGPLVPVLLASSCIPAVFKPVEMNGGKFVDGGVMNNFPTEPFDGGGYKVIGVNVNKLPRPDLPENWSMVKILEKVYHLAIQENLQEKKRRCDMMIEPETHDIRAFQVSKADLIYQRGYEEGMRVLSGLKDRWGY